MATSFAVLLFPLEVDDRAPPIDWRTRENMSQGYGETTESDLRLWGNMSGLETCPQSQYSQFISPHSKSWFRGKKGRMEVHTIKNQ